MDKQTQRIYQSAIRTLSRREHSRQEMHTKLRNRFTKAEGSEIDLVALLDQLETDGFLSDERFAESFIRSRVMRGQGPVKILHELSRRGVSPVLVEDALDDLQVNWKQLARQQREKKFGALVPGNFSDKAKQSRFLYQRGFDTESIQQAF